MPLGQWASNLRQARAPNALAAIVPGMNDVIGALRGGSEGLVAVLDEVTIELERVADRDLGWLRPLLVLRAQIEFTARRAPRLDPAALGEECGELGDLLTHSPAGRDDFSVRYATAHGASPRLRTLHDEALSLCRALFALTPC